MDQDRAHAQHAHARVRFRRSDLPVLDALPSAMGAAGPRKRFHRTRRLARRAGASIFFLTLLMAVSLTGGWLAINAGVGADRISREAETAIARLYGFPVRASLGHTRLSLANGLNLAFEIGDVNIRRAECPAPPLCGD